MLLYFGFIGEKWHPDKQKDEDSSTSRFQDINEAYQDREKFKSLLLQMRSFEAERDVVAGYFLSLSSIREHGMVMDVQHCHMSLLIRCLHVLITDQTTAVVEMVRPNCSRGCSQLIMVDFLEVEIEENSCLVNY